MSVFLFFCSQYCWLWSSSHSGQWSDCGGIQQYCSELRYILPVSATRTCSIVSQCNMWKWRTVESTSIPRGMQDDNTNNSWYTSWININSYNNAKYYISVHRYSDCPQVLCRLYNCTTGSIVMLWHEPAQLQLKMKTMTYIQRYDVTGTKNGLDSNTCTDRLSCRG